MLYLSRYRSNFDMQSGHNDSFFQMNDGELRVSFRGQEVVRQLQFLEPLLIKKFKHNVLKDPQFLKECLDIGMEIINKARV